MTSLIFRMDSLLAGKLFLPFEGRLACHCDVQRRLPVEIIPGIAKGHSGLQRKLVRLRAGITVRLQPGILFVFTPESFSAFTPESCSPCPESAAAPLLVRVGLPFTSTTHNHGFW